MSTVTTPADLDTLLGLGGAIDSTRAQLLLDMIEDDASTVVSPLPAAAKSVILTVAARAYTNPANNLEESTGSVSTRFGWKGSGGMYLTSQERRWLMRVAGLGPGAFTIDPTPADAASTYLDPLAPPTLDDSEQLVLDQPDPFITP